MGIGLDAVAPSHRRRSHYARAGQAFIAYVTFVISGITSISVSACSAYGINPITPTRAMVSGTWEHKGGAVLVLRGDGTFTGTRLPHFFGDWSGPTPRAGTGTWYIGRLARDAPRGVILNFSDLHPNIVDELLVEHCCGLPLTIYYDRGDPDQGISGQYQLTKQSPGN